MTINEILDELAEVARKKQEVLEREKQLKEQLLELAPTQATYHVDDVVVSVFEKERKVYAKEVEEAINQIKKLADEAGKYTISKSTIVRVQVVKGE